MIRKSSRAIKIGVACIASLALSAGVVAPANAETHTGTQRCSGSRLPQLTTDATGIGTGSWVNYDVPSQTQVFVVPAGNALHYSPYQRVIWTVNAPGFYQTPHPTCF